MKNVTLHTLAQLKQAGEKFTCLTAYDATFAHLLNEAGVEVILVGDSLGMVLQGKDSTLPVTVEDMAYHTACVKAGNSHSLIMADLPFMSYATPEQAMDSAAALMQAGAHLVKLEGGAEQAERIEALVTAGVPVMAHVGLRPQNVFVEGGYRVQRDQDKLVKDAIAAEQAGAFCVLIECVPSETAAAITAAVAVPTIGIGAGTSTTGQVLVTHDLLGLTSGYSPKFVRQLVDLRAVISDAVTRYREAIDEGTFPGKQETFD